MKLLTTGHRELRFCLNDTLIQNRWLEWWVNYVRVWNTGYELFWLIETVVTTATSLQSRLSLSIPTAKVYFWHYLFSAMMISSRKFVFIVPTSPSYDIKAKWRTRHEFEVEWKVIIIIEIISLRINWLNCKCVQYKPNDRTACGLTHYRVYLREGWRHYLYNITKGDKMIVPNRSSYFRYSVQIQAVTSRGPSTASELVTVTPLQGGTSTSSFSQNLSNSLTDSIRSSTISSNSTRHQTSITDWIRGLLERA